MRLQLYSRISARQWRVYSGLSFPRHGCPPTRSFSASARAQAIKPFLLADIGEGKFGIFVGLIVGCHSDCQNRNPRV